MNLKASRQRGVALLLVLMVCAIMAVIMLYLTGQGANNARMAGIIKQNVKGRMAVETAQAEFIFNLFTTNLAILGPGGTYGDIQADNPLGLNFSGEATPLDNLRINIQDMSGLVSLVPFNEAAFKQLLLANGVEQSRLSKIIDRLDDWQDQDSLRRLEGAERGDYPQPYLPKNREIQSLSELKYILSDDILYHSIEPYLAMYAGEYMVRQYTPKALYSAFNFDESQIADTGDVEPSGRFIVTIEYNESAFVKKRFVLYRGRGAFKPFYVSNEEFIFQ